MIADTWIWSKGFPKYNYLVLLLPSVLGLFSGRKRPNTHQTEMYGGDSREFDGISAHFFHGLADVSHYRRFVSSFTDCTLPQKYPHLLGIWTTFTIFEVIQLYKYLYCVFKKTIFCIYGVNIHGVKHTPIKMTHFGLHCFILSGSLIVNRVPGFRINDVVSFISGNFDSFRLLRRIALPDSHFSSFRVSLKITWATVTPPKHYESICVIALVRLQ